MHHSHNTALGKLVSMTQHRRYRILDMLRFRQPDLTIVAEAVHKPHNLSAVIRTCDAVGIGEIHAVAPASGMPKYNETSAGAQRWVHVHEYDAIETAITAVQARGITVYAAHFSDEAVDYSEIDYTQPSAVLIGTEKYGVTAEAAELSDGHIIIPMLGMVQSLNVSVATAAVLFEAQRQRIAAGMYREPRLSHDELRAAAMPFFSREDQALYNLEPQLLAEELAAVTKSGRTQPARTR